MTKKILVIAGGGKKHLALFEKGAETASFSDLNYDTTNGVLMVQDKPLSDYDIIYIRLVGKRFEDLALLVQEAKNLKIPVVDRVFTDSGFSRLPVSKLLETKILSQAGLLIPRTIFGKISEIAQKAPGTFGYPFVIKLTTGKQGHGVFAPRSEEELGKLIEDLRAKEKEGQRFLAQEFIKAPKRIRVLVVGEKVLGAIQRPTRWRKRFSNEVIEKKSLAPIPAEVENLAIKAAKTLLLDIAGVDILESISGKYYLLEVNSAPRWEAIKKDVGVEVENEILEFLKSKLK